MSTIQFSTFREAFASGRRALGHEPLLRLTGESWINEPPVYDSGFKVELIGIEPTTSGLQSPRSPS